MCGIAGILLPSRSLIKDMPQRLGAMAAAMYHRGPDDEGVYVTSNGSVGLASRRLAIQDLSPAGHMPMSNAEGTIWIAYNGEIYNAPELRRELENEGFSFRSSSDTEVILHGYAAWGESVVQKLNGMFAFAILSSEAPQGQPKQLFLARDHLGIKPLYYAQTADSFVFASELKAIHATNLVSREVSAQGLVGYLLMGSVPNPFTIYRDIKALEPASQLTIKIESSVRNPKKYWHLPTDIIEPQSYEDSVAQVSELLKQAVRSQLISDVPLGAFLSGGLDSSVIVGLMRQATPRPIRTCSMVFEESEYSEASYARAMADHVGAEHFERVITAQNLADEWENIFVAMDQPSVDGVNSYFVSQTARQAGLTVALSGLGGDELFGGYPNTFKGAPQLLKLLQWIHRVPAGTSLARAAISTLPDRHRWARFSDALGQKPSLASAYLSRRGLFAPSEVKSLVHPDLWGEAVQSFDATEHIAERADDSLLSHSNNVFAWTSHAELRTYMHHQLLRDTDVMSMAHSLEVRVPFLDKNLVEATLQLPARIKLKGNGPKPLMAQATGDLLPELVRERHDKQGFTFPFDCWLREGFKEQAIGAIDDIKKRDVLCAEEVEQVRLRYEARQLHWSRLWALMALKAIN